MVRTRATAIVTMVALSACGGPPTSAAGHEPVPEPAPAAADPYRYRPTLAGASAAGEVTEPIVELALRDRAELRIVVAVARPGAEPVVELWRFDQHNADDTLARVGAPEPLLRWDAGTDAPDRALRERLRVEAATPGSDLHRALGIPAATPVEALGTMARAAAIAIDRSAGAAARVQAIATVARGLDDDVLLGDDLLAPAIAALAGGGWAAKDAPAGERRASVVTVDGSELELLRKAEGWVVTRVRRQPSSSLAPAADPSPTAPRR